MISKYILSESNKVKQLFFLSISVVFSLGVAVAYFVTENENYLYILLLFCLIAFVINWIVSRTFDISIEGGKIHIDNLYYGNKIVDSSEFDSIQNVGYFIPLIYPFVSPPYYQFKLKDGRKYIFYDLSYKAISFVFKRNKKYSDFLTDKILDYLNL